MKTRGTNNSFLDRTGITGVTYPTKEDPVSGVVAGKSARRLHPATAGVSTTKPETLYASSIEMRMKQFLMPSISIQAVLQSHVYNYSLRSVRKKILTMESKEPEKLQRLALLLQEDEELKHLLQMYRNLLYKG